MRSWLSLIINALTAAVPTYLQGVQLISSEKVMELIRYLTATNYEINAYLFEEKPFFQVPHPSFNLTTA